MAKQTKKDKESKKILEQNQKILETAAKKKQQRHVQVKNEPFFDSLLNSFQKDYAKTVAGNSGIEILKLINSDEF